MNDRKWEAVESLNFTCSNFNPKVKICFLFGTVSRRTVCKGPRAANRSDKMCAWRIFDLMYRLRSRKLSTVNLQLSFSYSLTRSRSLWLNPSVSLSFPLPRPPAILFYPMHNWCALWYRCWRCCCFCFFFCFFFVWSSLSTISSRVASLSFRFA